MAVLFLLAGKGCAGGRYYDDPLVAPISTAVGSDYANFYGGRRLLPLVGFSAASAMANSSLDREIQEAWQDDLHGDALDRAAKAWRHVGEGEMAAIAVAAYAAGTYAPDAYGADLSREWGERNLRALLVGAPAMVTAQFLTGGSRPGESPHGSQWAPFEDANGVSGHTFMAAVPFITAAQMTDSLPLKSAFYAGSTLTGLARIHEDEHYASQVALGWLFAYLACDAVSATNHPGDCFEIMPLVFDDAVGVGIGGEY